MTEIFGHGWFEMLMQRQLIQLAGTFASIKAQNDAYEAKSRKIELEIDYAQRQLDFQNEIFESRHGEKMK